MRVVNWQKWCVKTKRAVVVGFICGLIFGIFNVNTALASGGETAPKSDADEVLFVKIEPIMVPVIKKNGRTSMLAIELVAEVTDEEAGTKVRTYMPRVRDGFIRALYGNVERTHFVQADGALNVAMIKKRLIASANYVLQKELVKDVLVSGINQTTF